MPELELNDQGLLIPRRFLAGFSHKVRLRSTKGGLFIESATQADARDQLRVMVDALRAGTDAPGDAEIAELVDQVRMERARHR